MFYRGATSSSDFIDAVMAYSSFHNPFGFIVTPWVKRIILINVGIFLLTPLAFRGLLPYLGFVPAEVLSRPWTLVTYMFVHGGFFHLLFNMLAVFFFGPPLEERWGSETFLKFYLLTGVSGAVLSFLFPHVMIVGASAAVYGIMVAFAMYWPDNPIYIYAIFPVKAKWLVGFLVGLTVLLSLTGGQSGVAHLAHLGGAISAFLYLKSGRAPSAWGPVTRSRKPRDWKVFSGRGSAERPPAPVPARSARVQEQERDLEEVDRILDKISEHGLSSLSTEERRLLDEASRRSRTD